MGYHPAQLEALRATINAAQAEVVVSATPCNLASLIALNKPVVRARYDFAEAGAPELSSLIDTFMREQGLAR